MSDKAQVYALWTTCKAFGLPPSSHLGIPPHPSNALLRFELDSAVAALGRYIDNKLDMIDERGKRKFATAADVIATARVKPPPAKRKPGSVKRPPPPAPRVRLNRRKHRHGYTAGQ